MTINISYKTLTQFVVYADFSLNKLTVFSGPPDDSPAYQFNLVENW